LPAVRRLLVVPTGFMAWVPLETLTSAYTVSYVPSGSVFARLSEKHRPLHGAPFMALRDPVFTPPERRLAEPPPHGLLVKLVLPGSNAARAGLKGGDVLLGYGSAALKRLTDLKPSTEGRVKARCWRAGQEMDLRLAAGPLGVVLTRWQVEDTATALLMLRFYQNLLGKRKGL